MLDTSSSRQTDRLSPIEIYSLNGLELDDDEEGGVAVNVQTKERGRENLLLVLQILEGFFYV